MYIIDGTQRPTVDNDAFEMSLFSFEYMLELLPPDKPILILINKQDLVDLNPLSTLEAIELYPIKKLYNHSVNLLPSSAKFGDGIDNAIKWIVSKLEEK